MASMGFQTIVEALVAAPSSRPFVTMWKDEDDVETVTFGEFNRRARAQAEHFRAMGLGRDESVILIMPQGIPLMTAFAGAMMLGAVPAILAPPNFKADPIKYSFGLAGVTANLKAGLIIVDDEFPEALLDRLARTDDTQVVRSTDDWPDSSRDLTAWPASQPESIAFIQHSAGTTGLQKGVALSHRAVLTQLERLGSALRLDDRDSIQSWLPLYHDMGLIACFVLPLVYHLPVVMQSPVDWVLRPGTMLQLISEYRCTLSWVPNFALQFLARRVRAEDRARYDLSSLRALINCSEPVRAESVDEFLSVYGRCGLNPAAVKSCYAMAENVFAVTQSDIAESPRRMCIDHKEFTRNGRVVPSRDDANDVMCLVSSGRCLEGNHVRIVSPDREDLADGFVGEIVIRSDSLFDGYYNRPDLTAEVCRHGWYHTGDLGCRVDDEVYVIGRKKDLIIVAGKNIYPQDIEETVCRHPAIHDGRAVAIGIYNHDLGTEEIVVAAEVEREGELSDAGAIERAVRDAIFAELDLTVKRIYLKPPRWIVKSTAGKPARSTTREKLCAEHPDLITPSRSPHEFSRSTAH